jgi:hypothetical protein
METLSDGLYVGGRFIEGDGADQATDARRHVSQLLGLDHLALLVGSGFSTAIAKASSVDPVDMAMTTFDLPFSDEVAAHARAAAEARGVEANLEDQLNAALTLASGLSVQGHDKAAAWREAIESSLRELAHSILEMERGIIRRLPVLGGDGASVQKLMIGLVAGFGLRGPSSDRLHMFTTNYDRLLELSCDLAGLRMTDRFVGAVLPRFLALHEHVDLHYPERRSAMPRPVAGVVRVGKLHGSVDWVQVGSDIVNTRLPIGGNLPEDGTGPLMIYPNAMKDVETAQYPYAPLFRDFSAAIARPQSVLFTYGYGYGDGHINRVIEEMLSIPNTHLCCVAFGDETGRIASFLDRLEADRWSLLLGAKLASLDAFVRLLPERAVIGDAPTVTGAP